MTHTRHILIYTAFVAAIGLPSPGFTQDAAPDRTEAEMSAPEQTGQAGGEDEYRIEDGTLVVRHNGEEHRLETPCSSPDVARSAPHFYLSCGNRGVYVVRRDPNTGQLEHEGYQRFDGDVTGFLQADAQVWARIRRTEARPIGVGDVQQTPDGGAEPVQETPSETPEPANQASAEPTSAEDSAIDRTDGERAVGDVIAVEPGAVIVNLGLRAGVDRDDHIELFREEQVALGEGETSDRIDTVAIGRVVAVSKSRARVELGLGERVGKSAKARPTGAPLTSYPTAPPRIGGLWEASFAVRPFLALRTVGVGTISSGRLVYRFEGPYAVHVNALPLSVGLAREGNVSAVGGDIALAYDARIFSLGLGVGAAQIGYNSLGGISLEEEAGPTITQFGRIGSRDGLHLRLHNSFVVANREFFYAGTDGVIQIPIDSVVSNSAIVLHGGGHVAGDVVGEAGLRLLVRGNGDRGSMFVTPTVGGGLVSNERTAPCSADPEINCEETVSYGGPLIGVELEWRL